MRSAIKIGIWLAALGMLAASAQAAIIETYRWNLGDNDPGAVNGANVNATTVAAAGGVDLTTVGTPTYTTTSTGLGISFDNPPAANSAPASNFLENAALNFTPANPAKTAIHARVKLNSELTTEAAVFHIGYGGPISLILQTDGAVASGNKWLLHIPGFAAVAGGDIASAANDYVDLVVATNGSRLQLYEGNNLVIDFAPGAFQASQTGLLIGASKNGSATTRGWDGQMDFVRILEYTGDFNIDEVLSSVPEPSSACLMVLGAAFMARRRRRQR